MQTVQEAYFRAARRQAKLLPIVRRIESSILDEMQRQGYGAGQMRAALLGHSRYPALADSKEEAAAYLEGILPKEAGAGDMRLANPQVAFEQGYERAMAKIEPQLREADKKALEAMADMGIPQADIREAYLGGSVYGDLEPNPVRRDAFERSVWQDARRRRREIMEAEEEAGRESFDELCKENPAEKLQTGAVPLALVEGALLTRFLLRGFHEETAANLLLERSVYSGKDKEAYAKKVAAGATKEAAAWRRIEEAPAIEAVQNDTEAYGAYLKGMCAVLGTQMLTFDQEVQAAKFLADHAEGTLADLKEGILEYSPAIRAAGREEGRTIEALLEGKDEAATYIEGDFVNLADTYRRILVDLDDAGIDAGEEARISLDRRRYNVMAARRMMEEYGAVQEEVKEVLKDIGGIDADENTDEYLSELVKDAMRVPKMRQEEAEEEERPVVWEGEAKSLAPAERERKIASTAKEILAEKKKLKGYAFSAEKVRTRDGMFAEEMYDACREQMENDIALPFSQQMDETIIQHMFAVGYEEREIEDTLNERSPLRMKQKSYAKNILKYVKEKPAVKDLLKSFVQTAVAKEETKYLQNKLERHEPLTRYEQERALVRDPIA